MAATQADLVQAVNDAVTALETELTSAPTPTPVDALTALKDAVTAVEAELTSDQAEEDSEKSAASTPAA